MLINELSQESLSVELGIVEPLPPADRDLIYGVPISKALELRQIGKIVGGGSSVGDREGHPGEAEICLSVIDIELSNGDPDYLLSELRMIIHELKLPFGSYISYARSLGEAINEEVGTREVLYIYIDNEGLSESIYESADMPKLSSAFEMAIEKIQHAEVRGAFVWPSEVLFYVLGPCADELFDAVKPLVEEYAILQNARIVFYRRDRSVLPVSCRLPFNNVKP